MVPFDGKYMSSYWIEIAMCALSLTSYETFANQIKCPAFDFEYEGPGGEKRE